MRKAYSFFLFSAFLFLCQNTHSQAQTLFPYDYHGNNLRLVDSLVINPTDTALIVITTRSKSQGSPKLFSDKDQNLNKYTTLICVWKNPNWFIKEVSSVKAGLALMGSSDNIVTFVHGDGKDFPLALNRAADIKLIFNVAVIAFDVPSLIPGLNKIKNFYNSRCNYTTSAGLFAKYVKELAQIKKEEPQRTFILHMHSLGNYVYMEALRRHSLDSCAVVFETTLMNAAAVNQKKHKTWLTQSRIQKTIYVTSNKKDHTLNGARFITFRKQLGERLKKPLAANAIYINFRNVAGMEHNYYRDLKLFQSNSNVKDFYMNILHGKPVSTDNPDRFSKRKDGLGFDIR